MDDYDRITCIGRLLTQLHVLENCAGYYYIPRGSDFCFDRVELLMKELRRDAERTPRKG
jgi:hypothetical protein